MILLNNIDITSLVDITSIVTNDTLDESLASGSMVIPFSTQNTPYARFSEVSIDGLLYVIAEDTVRLVRKGSNLYRHEISLIEPTKILQKRVIPNLTVTQPKGGIANFVYTVSRDIDNTVTNTLETLQLTTTSISQDTNIVDGVTLKNTNEYQIAVNYQVFADQVFDPSAPDNYLDIEFKVYYGNDLLATKVQRIDNGQTGIGGISTTVTPTVANQDVSITARTLGKHTDNTLDDVAKIVTLSLVISQGVGTDNTIYLDKVVDKLLQFHPTFALSTDTRARIKLVKSPEFTFQNYTLYDALKEVANYVSAIVYLGESDFETIHFYFYDQVISDELEYADQEQTEYLDGFTDGFEINASNVIRDDDQLYAIHEPDQFGWLTVRANNEERGVQILDNQTAIHLQHPIYKPIEVLVRGLAFSMLDESLNTVNFPNTQIWDITDYVLESQRYNTLESEEVTNTRGTLKRKSNTVFYTQGQPYIQGLGFTGTVAPAWNTQLTPNFAIVEAILNKAQEENPTYTFTTDYLIAPDINDLQFRLRHIPYSDVRLTVYKDNSRGNNIMYYNEQAPLNDMELLGRIAQENVNRSGNRVVRYEGLTNSNQLLLGSKKDNEVLVNYTISRTPTINKFVAEYAVGYANLSNYVGVDSAYRQYEVPVDTIVNRRDKLTQFFNMTVVNNIPTVSVPDYLDIGNNVLFDSLFANFKSNPTGSRPTYARVVLDNQRVVQSTIDAYRMGRTLGLAIDMQDNYSAGIKKVETRLSNGTDIVTQEDSRYTDDLGRFTQAEIEFYDLTVTSDLAESNNYPDNDKLGATKLFDYTYDVNKDARERYGFVWEIVIQGDDSSGEEVVVYDGFVKYNRLASELTPNTVEFRFLDKGYIPTRNLDITRTVLGTGSITVPTGERYAQVQANATIDGLYEGLVVTLNQEPIFAILSSDYDSGIQVTKYLYPRAFESNIYRENAVETIVANLTINGSKNVTGTAVETIVSNMIVDGSIFLLQNGQAQSQTISSNMIIDGSIFLIQSGDSTQTVSSNMTIDGSVFLTQSGNSTETVSSNMVINGSAFLTQTGNGSQSIQGDLTISGNYTNPVTLRGFTTNSPVEVAVQFENESSFNYTLQTFTQSIGVRMQGTDVTLTAPSSYVYNGDTYLFVDWVVTQTGESTTNTVFTITLNQDKTVRARYLAFGQ